MSITNTLPTKDELMARPYTMATVHDGALDDPTSSSVYLEPGGGDLLDGSYSWGEIVATAEAQGDVVSCCDVSAVLVVRHQLDDESYDTTVVGHPAEDGLVVAGPGSWIYVETAVGR